ncbi:MAG: hypothetical protein LBT40_15635 [Deltaproteobacteria bacterium]|jgi:hypothetical protein|nr:hypothetical protein [Deltaproteobacteria bacterium]
MIRLPRLPAPSALAVAAFALASAGHLAATPIPGDWLNDAVFENQPPPAASDLPAAREFLTLSGDEPTTEQAREAARKHGSGDRRLAFVTAKLMAGVVLLADVDVTCAQLAEQMGSELAQPTDAELEVMRPLFREAMPARDR